jgi:hypothetical protein
MGWKSQLKKKKGSIPGDNIRVGFGVLTDVITKNPFFFGCNTYSSEKARRFGGKSRLHFMGKTVSKARNQRYRRQVGLCFRLLLLVSCLILLVDMKMEAIRSYWTSDALHESRRSCQMC